MAKLFSLFDDPQRAEDAVKVFAEHPFSENSVRVIDELPDPEEGFIPAAATPVLPMSQAQTTSNMSPTPGPDANVHPLADFDLPADERRFLEDGVREGGVLLVVDVDQTNVARAREILEGYGGRTGTQV